MRVMGKIGRRIVLGLAGVAGVGTACVAAYLYGEHDGRNAVKTVIQYVDVAGGKGTRTISHRDGSQSVYILNKGSESNVLRKYDFSRNGELFLMTIYRVDGSGKPMAAKIFDSRKEELLKVSYGYRKSDGLLVEERVFDAKTKRTSEADGRELPVQRYIHVVDESGTHRQRVNLEASGPELAQREVAPFVNPFAN